MATLERRRSLIMVAAAFLAAMLFVGSEASARSKSWRGEFVYFADSALFTDCKSGKRWPVAMEEDYLALEKAYVESHLQPQAPLLVSLRGRLEAREPMEGPVREHLVVEKFKSSKPGATCKSPRQANKP